MTGMQKFRGMRLLIFITVILFMFAAASTIPVRGDAGGWPTNTPSPTIPAPTATTAPGTAYPSVQLFSLPPTNTPSALQLPLTEGQSSLSAQVAATPIPVTGAGSAFSIIACWPFALVALVILIFGLWWVRNRLGEGAYQ